MTITGFIEQNEFLKKVKSLWNATPKGASSVAKRQAANIIRSKSIALPEMGRLNEFEEAGSFTFDSINATYNNESIVRQAIDKYVDLMFKSGWSLTGKNQAAVDYVKMRLALLAEGTGIPTEQLLIEIAEDFVLYHNVFILKVRQSNTYQFPSGVKVISNGTTKPVTGLFLVAPSSITIKRNQNGTVLQYKQEVDGVSGTLVIKPDDMIHIYRNKPRGKGFGVPFLTPVVNDIKLLRIIEELVGKLIYKEAFPIISYIVGTDERPATDDEIVKVKTDLTNMPLDGMVVMPERHKIDVTGAGKEVLDLGQYLDYFEKRVFTGLGVSETLMGQGEAASRSTAENLSAQLNDKIKAYQKSLSVFVNDKIINSLLIEGGFDPVINPIDAVSFDFKEIDLDSKIKVENHAIQKFAANAITHEEMRIEMGMDPVTDEARLAYQMIQQYLDAQAANNQIASQVTPTNQHTESFKEAYKDGIVDVSQKMPRDRINEYAAKINSFLESVKQDLLDKPESKTSEFLFSLITKQMEEYLYRYSSNCFYNAINLVARQELNISRSPYIEFAEIKPKIREKYINGLHQVINKCAEEMMTSDNIENLIDNYTTRVVYVLRDAGFASYNLGVVALAKKQNIKILRLNSENDCCELCQSYQKTGILVNDESSMPPYHNHCTCLLTIKQTDT